MEALTAQPDIDRSELIERARRSNPLLDGDRVSEVVGRAWKRAHGLGPIGDLLTEPDVTEIMINGAGPVWIDRAGTLVATPVRLDADDIMLLIERILDPLGLRVDRLSPLADARLADGSRVNIVIPPLALDGPVVTIRRFAARAVPVSEFGPPEVVDLLKELVEGRATVLVSGGTGAGKTTLLNGLGGLLRSTERLVVIEDTSELRLPGEHVVRLESRPANSEGVGAVTLRDLVKNALRMRPDRILIGEVRGGEAIDLLMALNTGHTGALSTLHANSAQAALLRLGTLASMGGLELSPAAIEANIGSAVDAIVQVERRPEGRVIVEVARVRAGPPLSVEQIWVRP